MSRKHLFAWLATVVFFLAGAPLAHAQKYSPFIEPDYFNPDFQFFAPADVTAYDDAPEANIGWFFAYDRAFMNVSRATTQLRPWEGDETWGNRFELGFMTNDDSGWLATIWHIDGPSFEERIPNSATTSTTPVENGSGTLTSVELAKTWRKHLHNGAILEPMVGFRYADYSESYLIHSTTFANGAITSNNDVNQFVQNNVFGGLLGVRIAKQQGHWNLSGDFRISAGPNFEYFNSYAVTNPVAAGPTPFLASFANASMFSIVGTARADASYQLTRDVALHFGVEIDDYAKGIGRVQDGRTTDNHFVAAGMTMGFTINR